jgi:hypothetical protein
MLDRIEDAIDDIRNGKMIIVVDDEDRENEGDFIIAAQHATPEVINFMSKEGRGLICAALTEERCKDILQNWEGPGIYFHCVQKPVAYCAEQGIRKRRLTSRASQVCSPQVCW